MNYVWDNENDRWYCNECGGYRNALSEDSTQPETVAESFDRLRIALGEAAEAVAIAMKPFAEFLEKIRGILDELEDEKEAARKRSRDDLSQKRNTMKGKGRHILPPKR